MDNRFAYMRKHLGISQKEASVIFNTRLDTIKKWDADRLSVPQAVLEELYDLVRVTRTLIAKVVKEHKSADEDNNIAEVYLHIPDAETMDRYELPRSAGWIDRVIGGIIGDLAMFHTYATKEIPDHYELDFQWYDFWENNLGSEAVLGFVAVTDESVFAKDLELAIKDDSFTVRYDYNESYYYLGFTSTAVRADTNTVWIKACNGGRYANMSEKEKVHFFCLDGSYIPYVYDADDYRETVGLLLDDSSVSNPIDENDEDEFTDSYSLGELIFEKLAAKYPTQEDLLSACRRISGQELGAHETEGTGQLSDWGLKKKRLMSHKFVVTLFEEVMKQSGMVLYPEALIEVCNIMLRSEPAEKDIDHQYLTINLGDVEITVFLDLRDIIDVGKANIELADEMDKAMNVIQAVMQGNEIATIPAHSTIEAVALGQDDQPDEAG